MSAPTVASPTLATVTTAVSAVSLADSHIKR